EYYSPNILYYQDKNWQKLVKEAMNKREKINKILSELKEHIREYPFAVICENCGRIGSTNILNYDPETEEIEYLCESRRLKKKTVEGCGYKGKTKIRNGKLDWYVEWALDWKYFDADVEPLSKEHYVSSWKVSPKISREVFNQEEPIPVLYELFTINGKKMSSSKGNIYNINFFLKILEPEVFVYYLYTKRPFVQREITLSRINQAVDEFDKLEEEVFNSLEKEKLSQDEIDKIVNYYLSFFGKIPENKPVRVSYSFLAVIGQLLLPKELINNTEIPLIKLDPNLLERYDFVFSKIREILKRTGHIKKDLNNFEFYKIIDRARKASFWARNFAPSFLKIELNQKKEDLEFNNEEKEILNFILNVIEDLDKEEKINLDDLQTKIHKKISEKLDSREFYKKLYKILIGKEGGPKISSLIVAKKEEIKKIIMGYL
ncbi:MAG TPA: lysine--tRNA ligase, partial [Nautiliaceae bacterium]|nr:lysine--tRNA ligase [Nautiliaceae bacterium]